MSHAYFLVMEQKMPAPMHISPSAKIALPSGQGFVFVALSDILYFKAANNEVIMFCRHPLHGATQETIVFKSIGAIEGKLLLHGFLRIRRDYIINTCNIKLVKKRKIIMCNEEILYPSRDKAREVENYFKENFYI